MLAQAYVACDLYRARWRREQQQRQRDGKTAAAAAAAAAGDGDEMGATTAVRPRRCCWMVGTEHHPTSSLDKTAPLSIPTSEARSLESVAASV
jgi:hypothetical protein